MQQVRQSTKLGGFLILASLLFLSLSGLSLGGCSSLFGDDNDKSRIRVLGSDTMEELVRKWANGFMTDNEGVQVTVQSGDTGSGITGLIEGKVDVASASRELTEAEQKAAHEKKIHLKRIMVARDSIAIIVNLQNKLAEIGLDDLQKVYGGETETWDKLIPGLKESEPIRVFGREKSSGTFDYFRDHVMNGKPFGQSVKMMSSSEAVIGAVYGNRLGIGFVGMAQAQEAREKVKILELSLRTQDIGEPGNAAAITSLSSDTYPLSRPLYLYFDQNKDTKVEDFIRYVMGGKGQKTVAEMGFMTAQ